MRGVVTVKRALKKGLREPCGLGKASRELREVADGRDFESQAEY